MDREDLEQLLHEGADEVGLRGAVTQLGDELRQADASGTSAEPAIAAWERGSRKVPIIKLLGRAARSSDLALQLLAERLSDRDSNGSPAFEPYPGHVAEGVAFCAAEALVACGQRAVPAIVGQLENPAGREMAAQALARIGAHGRGTITTLLEHARCDDWMTALALARALEVAGASPEDWERLLADPATARVPLAVQWPSEPSRRLHLAPEVLRLLPLPALRGHAARWLGELGRDATPEVAAALEAALQAGLDFPPGSDRVIREALRRVRGERS